MPQAHVCAYVQDLGFWQGRLGVHRAPSVVFLRGPGAVPAVYDASNTKRLDVAKLVADNAWQVTLLRIPCLASAKLRKSSARNAASCFRSKDMKLKQVAPFWENKEGA